MCHSAKGSCCALALSAILFGWPAASWSDDEYSVRNYGFELFVTTWFDNDSRCDGGDGLGPMHNATSCAECHDQKGVGGGGGSRADVLLLSHVPVPGETAICRSLLRRLTHAHRGFTAGRTSALATITLHNSGADKKYLDFRRKFINEPERSAQSQSGWGNEARTPESFVRNARKSPEGNVLGESVTNHNVSFVLNRRNTPALWGAGLIDKISSEAIEEIANEQQQADEDGIHGRAPRADSGGVGRFGWRGQTATLRDFVLGACSNELGLQVEGHPQAINPLSLDGPAKASDLNAGQCDALIAFVAGLPRPQAAKPSNAAETDHVLRGEQRFEEIGCAICHMPKLGEVEGLYSDLLLHDMGRELADIAAANPPIEREQRMRSGSHRHQKVAVETATPTPRQQREWRTPPLWGVADSAPYLHDGRANNLRKAIELHAGEAFASAERFREVSTEGQTDILAFLETLKAPRYAPRLPGKHR